MPGRVRFRGQVGGRYVAWMRGAFIRPRSKQCEPGKPETNREAVGSTRASGAATGAKHAARPATV